MVKFNEALIIGGSLLLALVLSKSGDFIKKIPMPQNRPVSVVSPIAEPISIPKVQIYEQQKPIIVQKPKTNKILLNILDQEKLIRDEKVAQIQTELDQTNQFIESQKKYLLPSSVSKYAAAKGAPVGYLYKDNVTAIIRQYGSVTDDNIIKYVNKLLEIPENRNPLSQRFPAIPRVVENLYNSIIEKQNRAKAQQFADTQQAEISNILNEYETRFGGLSRYG